MRYSFCYNYSFHLSVQKLKIAIMQSMKLSTHFKVTMNMNSFIRIHIHQKSVYYTQEIHICE